jgi:hypothetical protein
MEDWERRALHDRAVYDALAKSRNQPLPIHPDGGVTKVATFPFIGLAFWKLLQEAGHTCWSYENCDCNNIDVVKH